MKRRSEATYVDTSVWCAYCFNEEGAQDARNWLFGADLTRLGTAWWTETEFASALGIQQRSKAMTTAQALRAQQRFVESMGMVHRLNVIQPDYLEAAAAVADGKTGLRGGDALHLAVAQRHGCTAIATLDLVMQRNAKRLGFHVTDFSKC